jgi:hypothetical protein
MPGVTCAVQRFVVLDKKEQATFVLLDCTTLSDHTVRIGAIAGLPRRPQTKGAGEPADVTLALSNLVGKPVKETLGLFCSDPYRANRKSLGGRGRGAAIDPGDEHNQT